MRKWAQCDATGKVIAVVEVSRFDGRPEVPDHPHEQVEIAENAIDADYHGKMIADVKKMPGVKK